ncbi:MAG: hypothetical protein OEM50_00730 [Gammaproteobacteria bacterium]|nr:hypothetical protein [Gammaproteobacteria bacterium]MDH3480209.1 hypothetical protein [Gammaproteobacteria bacterium]
MEIARNRGLNSMEGQVLSSSKKMLEPVASLGFRIEDDPDDDAIKQIEASLHT